MRNITQKVVRFTTAGLSVAGLLLCLGQSAKAQVYDNVQQYKPDPVAAVRVGVFFPQNTRVKDSVANSIFSVGLDYVVNKVSPSYKNIISVDYIDHSNGDFRLRMIPVTYGGIRYYELNTFPRMYTGWGLGCYFLNADTRNSLGFKEEDHSSNVWGGYIAIGCELKDRVFLDARYHFTTTVGDVNPSGPELMAGVRF